ncbi:MAG: hypothetical protein ACI85I_001367, partial [Arenicella sp.]
SVRIKLIIKAGEIVYLPNYSKYQIINHQAL